MVKRPFHGIINDPDLHVEKPVKKPKPKMIKVRRIWAMPRNGAILVRRLDDRRYYLADWGQATPPERIFEVNEKALRDTK